MIGIIIPGQLIVTGGPVTANMVVSDVNNPSQVNNISLFQSEALPDGYAASLYYSVPPYSTLEFLGCVCNQRPSDIFYTGWSLNPLVNVHSQIKICVKLEKLTDIQMAYEQKIKFDIIFKTLKRAPYALIPFVLSMFVIVLTLTNEGVTSSISNLLNKTNPVFSFGIGGALIANLINNIPMSVLFANMTFTSSASIYASIIASNIAAYITPVGALAGIMWMSLLKTYEIDFSFKKFSMYGLIIGIPTLLAALLTLFIII